MVLSEAGVVDCAGVITFVKRGCYKHRAGLVIPPASVTCINETVYGFAVHVCKCHESLCNDGPLSQLHVVTQHNSTGPPRAASDIGRLFHVVLATVTGHVSPPTSTPTHASSHSQASTRGQVAATVWLLPLVICPALYYHSLTVSRYGL